MISNWELSDPPCESVRRGLTLVRLRFFFTHIIGFFHILLVLRTCENIKKNPVSLVLMK